MPAKNSRKTYADDGIYHIYNRGVEKRKIFQDEQDYKVFLGYLKEYLLPQTDLDPKEHFLVRGTSFIGVKRRPKNYFSQIELLVYSLMPNHFHLIIKANIGSSLKKFMQSILTRYSMYFNKKYDRVGSLFQDRYKAILVNDEAYLLYLSRYIHRNPLEFTKTLTKAYSSYAEYLGLRKTEWINTKVILSYFDNKVLPDFKKINNYKEFVENEDNHKELDEDVKDIILE